MNTNKSLKVRIALLIAVVAMALNACNVGGTIDNGIERAIGVVDSTCTTTGAINQCDGGFHALP